MSLRMVPSNPNPQTHSSTSHSAPSAPGIHDTLRAGLSSDLTTPANVAVSSHPLESRLKNWEATQEALKMETLRRTYGMAEPIRRGMELKMVRDSEWRPAALGGGAGGLPSVHEDILRNRDASITWEDVFTGDETRGVAGVHDEMERKLKI